MAQTARAGSTLVELALAALLAGCSAAQPPPPAPTRAALHPAGSAPVLRGPSRYLASSWSFSVTENACLARTYHPELSLSVTVGGPAEAVALAMEASAPPGPTWRNVGPAEFDFRGASGNWRVRARIRGRTVSASLPPTETGLGDVLALLGGGQLVARTIDGSLPGLHVPDADVAGRDWFSCARGRLTSRSEPRTTSPEPDRSETDPPPDRK